VDQQPIHDLQELLYHHVEPNLIHLMKLYPVVDGDMTKESKDYNMVEPFFVTHPSSTWRMGHHQIAIGQGIFTHDEIDG
jgi:hypothetical protein